MFSLHGILITFQDTDATFAINKSNILLVENTLGKDKLRFKYYFDGFLFDYTLKIHIKL